MSNPLFVGLVTSVITIAGAYLATQRANRRSAREHALAVLFIPAGASKPEYEDLGTGNPIEDVMLGAKLRLKPPPPGVSYEYRVMVQNSGHYPETDVQIAVEVDRDMPREAFLGEWDVTCSSGLVQREVEVNSTPFVPWSVTLLHPRLNPGEWISFGNAWSEHPIINVEVRSAEVTQTGQRAKPPQERLKFT